MAWVRNRGTGRKKRWEIHWVNEHNREVVESCSQRTREDAERYAQDLEARAERIRRGVQLKEVPRVTLLSVCEGTYPEDEIILREVSKGYFKDVLPHKSNPDRREAEIRRHVLTYLGDRFVGELLPVEIDRWTDKLKVTPRGVYNKHKKRADQPISPKTVLNARNHLSAIYRYLKRKLKLPVDNPVASAERIELDQREPTPFELEHVGPLLANVPGDVRTLFATAVCVGPRKGELAGLLCGDVDLEKQLIKVRRSYDKLTTKTKKKRFVAVPDFLIPALRSQIAGRGPDELLFPEQDGSMMPSDKNLVKLLRVALKRAGIVECFEHTCRRGASKGRNGKGRQVSWGCGKKVRLQTGDPIKCPDCKRRMWIEPIPKQHTFKDLRATFATYALETSKDLESVQDQMGHTRGSEVTLDAYAKIRAQRLVAHANRLPFKALLPDDMVEEEVARPFDVGPGGETLGSQLPGPRRKAVASATNPYHVGPSQMTEDTEKHQGKQGSGTPDPRLITDWSLVRIQEGPTSKPAVSAEESRRSTKGAGPDSAPNGSQLSGAGGPTAPGGTKPKLRAVDGGAERLLTVRQVAEHLSLSTATVYGWVNSGALPSVRYGSHIRIRFAAIEALLARNTVPTPKGSP